MNIVTNIFHKLMTLVTIMTACGVFMHDGRVDKAALTAIRYYEKPVLLTTSGTGARFRDFVATDAHTHPDHNAARSSLMSSFAYQSPSIPPRDAQGRRHFVSEPRGRHAFDNNTLPLLV